MQSELGHAKSVYLRTGLRYYSCRILLVVTWMVTRIVTKRVTKIWLLAWFSGRKSTKNHEIAYMQGARARVHLHACQKKFNRLSADDPVYIWEWFAVCFLAVQRTKFCCCMPSAVKIWSVRVFPFPILEKLFSILTRFFLYSCKFHTAAWLPACR